MLYLDIPSSEIETAMKLGACWDAQRSQIYIRTIGEYYKYVYWMLKENDEAVVYLNNVFLVEGAMTCPHCEKETMVIGFSPDDIIVFNIDPYVGDNDEIIHPELMDTSRWMIAKHYKITKRMYISPLPQKFVEKYEEQLKDEYNFKKVSASQENEHAAAYANHCKYCGELIEDRLIYDVDDKPFFSNVPEIIEKITFKKVDLTCDVLGCISGWYSDQKLYGNFAKFVDSSYEFSDNLF